MVTEIHDLTKFIHELRGCNKIVAERGFSMNKEGRPFSYYDFQDVRASYRKSIQFLNEHGCLERVGRGKPHLWKFCGIKLTGDSKRITFRDKGVGNDFYDLLEQHKYEQPMIHDIKLKIYVVGVHDALVKKGCTVNTYNKRISLGFPYKNGNFTIKSSIYPSIIQLDISNTFKPLVYDITSLLDLHELLAQFSYYIYTLSDVRLPPVNEWIFTHYHIHTDLSFEYAGKSFEVKVNDFVNGMIRFYSKHMGNGKHITRLEQIHTPHTTIIEEIQKSLEFKTNSRRNYHE